MGIVNVTPDSFSDGGSFIADGEVHHDAAIAHGLQLLAEGADIVDVGGESTRPGSVSISLDEELARVVPVVAGLAAAGAVVSIDTSKAAVAEAAVRAGAEIVNDVTALRDPDMRNAVAGSGVGVVLMHMQGTPATMQDDPTYEDVVFDVRSELVAAAAEAEAAGVMARRICLDPGIGFGKTIEHNLELLDRLGELADAGYPLLIGTSRKGFLRRILEDTSIEARDIGTAATVALAIDRGASVARVHNVATATHSARVADAIVR